MGPLTQIDLRPGLSSRELLEQMAGNLSEFRGPPLTARHSPVRPPGPARRPQSEEATHDQPDAHAAR